MASQLGNEPAFPFSQHTEVAQTTQHAGLTKREAYVAALAANPAFANHEPAAVVARADALLAALAGGDQ